MSEGRFANGVPLEKARIPHRAGPTSPGGRQNGRKAAKRSGFRALLGEKAAAHVLLELALEGAEPDPQLLRRLGPVPSRPLQGGEDGLALDLLHRAPLGGGSSGPGGTHLGKGRRRRSPLPPVLLGQVVD